METVILDGAMGTRLQAMGLQPGEDPTDWNFSHPDRITAVHRAYVEAGAQIVLANTFGANRLKYRGEHDLDGLVASAIRCAKASGAQRVALDVGPTGRLLKPAGDLDFDTAYDAFAALVKAGAAAGADLVFIETITDSRELKAAILAAKENSTLPVYASVALDENGKLLTGADVETLAEIFNALDVAACGFNCGLGPDRLLPYVKRLAARTVKPIIVKANAGMPQVKDGVTVFPSGPEAFAKDLAECVRAGAAIVGGCCGTTPEHIRQLFNTETQRHGENKNQSPLTSRCASSTSTLELKPGCGLIIGERINPTGKKRLKEAYKSGDIAYVLREAVTQVEAGAAALDVNCGVPGIDEAATLDRTLAAVESVTTVPIQIDTADPQALALALKHVGGKAIVNSVNGKRESMDAVFPLVKRYGGLIVALCLDENGIPETVEGRLAIAEKILAEGAKYGFTKADFVFDALTLAVSADPNAAIVTLETVKRLTEEIGVNTVLGVSNVSFGLPDRPALNNAMYTLAKRAGLSAAIANPSVIRESDDPAAFDVLLGRDPNCARWIAAHAAPQQDNKRTTTSESTSDLQSVLTQRHRGTEVSSAPPCLCDSVLKNGESPTIVQPSTSNLQPGASLRSAIGHGLKEDAAAAVKALLAEGVEPMKAIDEGIVPALEEVGRGFEQGRVFLPQLLMAADAASAAFAVLRSALATARDPSSSGLQIADYKSQKNTTAVLPSSSNLQPDSQPSTSNLQPDSQPSTFNLQPSTSTPIILATVKGDVHDIGKNIVRALLENYGFQVIDLGRDVAPERIVEAALKNGSKLVGLSALMTTTVGAMAETIRQLKAADPAIRTFVGGAVLTADYAAEIGATWYAKDAMASVRIAEGVRAETQSRTETQACAETQSRTETQARAETQPCAEATKGGGRCGC